MKKQLLLLLLFLAPLRANAITGSITTSSTACQTAAAQGFTGTPSSCVANHVHVENINSATTGGTNGFGVDTSTNTSSATGYSTANPTGGSATCTPAGTNGTAAVTGTMNSSAVTGTLNSTTLTPLGSNASSAVSGTSDATSGGTPAGTLDSVSGGTPSGSVSAPTFTGASAENRSSFVKVIFCSKT